MEIQLRDLIEQIKKDGVATAEAEAAAIIDAAKTEAEKILSDARAQADKIVSDAKSENERMVKSGEDALRQAGRNLLISFRESITRELDLILNKNVSAAYSSESFSKIIINVVEGWTKNPEVESVAAILSSEDLQSLEDTLLAQIKEKMLSGVTLKANDNFDGGFRIAVNDGSAYYDYSAEAVVDMLSGYLSPKLTKLLREA
ncbi:MAG: V-type ATP synthase subunit E [Clostridia bacterium]|nr:V-type ATP synthase subunit E [Clostridia bacterium]MBR0025775.1 V-type ATP synthase subunit E [Clostridia bacterium]